MKGRQSDLGGRKATKEQDCVAGKKWGGIIEREA